jgi:hypothetical protein
MCNYYESSLFTTKLMMILFSLLVILFQYEQSIALYIHSNNEFTPIIIDFITI